jgi:ATP-dependent Clp protease ATP-binding subunit ClpA
MAPRVEAALNAAEAEAQAMKDEYVSVEHLLLALAAVTEGAVAWRWLSDRLARR